MKKKYYRFFYYLNTLSKALNNKQNFLTPEIKDLIDSEKFLDLDILIQKLILEFRKKFLNINFIEFSDKYKSPEINTEIFSYERAFDKTDFFLEELNKLPKNFFCFRNLTNSGMSAISLILLLLKKILNHFITLCQFLQELDILFQSSFINGIIFGPYFIYITIYIQSK